MPQEGCIFLPSLCGASADDWGGHAVVGAAVVMLRRLCGGVFVVVEAQGVRLQLFINRLELNNITVFHRWI